MFQLGNTYQKGIFTPVNGYKALQWHYLARLLGNINSSCEICRYCNHLFNQNDDSIHSVFSKMCQNNIDFALCREGEENQYRNPEYALECFEKAIALNFAPAIHWLFVSSRLGRQNDISLLKQAAELNYIESKLTLAKYFAKGEILSKDIEKYYKYMQQAADLGDSKAQYQIGLFYYKGTPVTPKDLSKAIIWLTRSALQGNTDAVFRLGMCYLYGKGVERNFNTAFSLLIRHHDCSNADVLKLIGFCYENGLGTTKDYNKAYKYYLSAIYTFDGCSWAENHLENICNLTGLCDETFVRDKEYEQAELIDEHKYSQDGRRLFSVWNGYKDFDIKEGCEVLCDYSINDLYSEIDCYYVHQLTLPKSLKRIGNNVFCASIETIINKSLSFEVVEGFLLSHDRETLYRYFGKNKIVTIPSSVKYIKGGAFSDKEISQITIPDGVIYIGSNPFVGTNFYTNISDHYKNVIINNHRFFIKNNTLYSKKDHRLVSYLGNDEILKILDDTKIIGENAFFNAQLKAIYLPRSINIIHESAFYYCVLSLEKVFVPKEMINTFLCILPKYIVNNVKIEEY